MFGSRLGDFDIHCVHSFFAALGIEGDGVAFADVVHQTGDVYKNFFFWRVVNNKPKSLGLIEEFYDSTVHWKKIENDEIGKAPMQR